MFPHLPGARLPARPLAPGPDSSSSSSRHCSWTQQPGAHRVAFGGDPGGLWQEGGGGGCGRRRGRQQGKRQCGGGRARSRLCPSPRPPSSPRSPPRVRGDKAGGVPRSPRPPRPLIPAADRFLPCRPRSRARPLTLLHCAEETKWRRRRRRRRGLGARAAAPPHTRPLGRRRRHARGVRAHRAPGRRLPGAGLCLLRPPGDARTCLEHTPPRVPSFAAGRPPFLTSYSFPIPSSSLSPSRPRFQESPRFLRRETSPPLSSRGAERRTPPWKPLPTRTAEEAFVGSSGFQISSQPGLSQIRVQTWKGFSFLFL